VRWTALALFLACLAVYESNGRPKAEVDCVAATYTAWSLVRHGSLDLRHYPEVRHLVGTAIRERPDGTWVSIRSPGSAIAAVPVVAPLALLRERPPGHNGMLQLGKLAAALCVAAAAVLFYLVCRRCAPDAAWPATVLFALGTSLCSVASQALWTHGPATLWLCVALYALTRPDADRPRWGLLAGLALGMAALTRPTTVFFGLATGAVLLLRRQWGAAVRLAAGVLVPAALLVLLNWATFGDPLLGGYADDNWGESPPLWLGIGGLLLAPSRGALVYSPALLLVVPGVVRLLRRDEAPRGLLQGWLVAVAATVLFYARWHDWRGGWCYGPRFLCETMPALCLLFAFGYSSLAAGWQRGAAQGLIALSVAVHFLGLFGHQAFVDWHWRHERPDQGRCLFELRDTQIEAHARAVARKLTGAARPRPAQLVPGRVEP
jgi:hypothetical protein